MKKRSFVFLFLVVSTLIFSACGNEGDHSPPPTIEYGKDHPLHGSNKEYAKGALKPALILDTTFPRDVIYTVENQTSNPITLTFRNGLIFDAAIEDASGDIVYRRSDELMVTQALEERSLEEGEAWSFQFELPETLKSGEYTLKVWLDSQDEAYDLVSKTETTIQIQ